MHRNPEISFAVLKKSSYCFLLILLLVCTINYYRIILPLPDESRFYIALQNESQTIAGFLFILPLVYAQIVFKKSFSIYFLLFLSCIMVPYSIFVSDNIVFSLFEISTMIFLFGFVTLWLDYIKKEIGWRKHAILKSEEIDTYLKNIEQQKERFYQLDKLVSQITQIVILDDILDDTLNDMANITSSDIILLYFPGRSSGKFVLKSYLVRDCLDKVDFMQPLSIDSCPDHPIDITITSGADSMQLLLPSSIKIAYLVPLLSKHAVMGAVIVGRAVENPYEDPIKKLVQLMSNEFAIVAERSMLTETLREYANRITSAHETERLRIARELHDDTIQSLTAITRKLDLFLTDSAQKMPYRNHETIEKAIIDIEKTVARVRNYIQNLRPPLLEYLGLIPALRELAENIQSKSGIKVVFSSQLPENQRFCDDDLLVYRIAQEALTNAEKHSGADKIWLRVFMEETYIYLTVKDNGNGFDFNSRGFYTQEQRFGILGMKERAALLNGNLSIVSRVHFGTMITLKAPIKHIPAISKGST